MRSSNDVIEIDNYVILSTFRVFILENILFLYIDLVEIQAEPNISKLFKTNIIMITNYHNINWNIVKSLIFD